VNSPLSEIRLETDRVNAQRYMPLDKLDGDREEEEQHYRVAFHPVNVG